MLKMVLMVVFANVQFMCLCVIEPCCRKETKINLYDTDVFFAAKGSSNNARFICFLFFLPCRRAEY